MLQREDRFTVNAFDCHPDGRIKLNALMQYLQESAARHAGQLHAGFADLDERGCCWVLTNLRLEVARTPRWTDDFTITTWPSGYTRLAASREFVGTLRDGNELFRAASEWMVLDKRSGRPKSVSRLGLDLPEDGPKVLPEPLHRLEPVATYARVHGLRVPYSALDFNGHVNNTEYIRWASDALYRRFRRTPEVRAAQVTYLAEVFEGDEIEVLLDWNGEGQVRILERKLDSPAGTDVFLMEAALEVAASA